MKKTTSLLALLILVWVEVFNSIVYAYDVSEVDTKNIEGNVVEIQQELEQDLEQDLQKSEESLENFQVEDKITELEKQENSQLLEAELEAENVENKDLKLMNKWLFQIQNLGEDEIDLTNPVQLYRNWELTWSYTWLSQAINESESGDVINIVEDISVSEASVISWKMITINGNNHIITREADVTTLTVNEDSSLKLIDITITDNAVNFAPNRYNSLLTAKSNIPLCLWWVKETKNESWDVTASVCATENVDVAKTHPQIYSVGNIYGENLTISNSLNSKWSAAIIVEKWWIEMINSSFIHNWASGTSNAWRGWAIRVWPNTATNIVDESPITKIAFSWCLFEWNYARNHGWVLSLQYTPETITIDNCAFSGNTAYGNWWAIHIPNVDYNPTWYLPRISTWSLMPIGTLYINDSDFYSNRCGNDGAVMENDNVFLKIDSSNFEHNYGTQPYNTSVWVISSQAWWRTERSHTWYELKITNSNFKDTNTYVLGDHNMYWYFDVDNCLFDDQYIVLLSYNWRWEIKNSTIKNSKATPWECTEKSKMRPDIVIAVHADYLSRIPHFWESTLKLSNNKYSNDCAQEYFQIRSSSQSTWTENIIIEDEAETRIIVTRAHYDNVDVEWTDEIYYSAKIDGQNYAYIVRDKLYNFDEFNAELERWTTWYQLDSWKAMLFYLDSGYTQLWSGAIHTTTPLFWKETDIHNITYEWMDWVDFEWITHTFKFINLNHTQYLTELTPYTLNTPSRNWYKFEWRFLDSEYTIPVTSIEAWTTWDVILYAKREKLWYSGWWGGGGWSSKPNDSKQEGKPEENSQNDVSTWDSVKNPEEDSSLDSQNGNQNTQDSSNQSLEWQYSTEFQQAYEFAKWHWITTMPTIQKADMEGNLTRIQMAKMLSQYAINVLWKTPDTSKNNKFRDVSDKEDAGYDYGVTLAYQLWIMWQNMPNNKFRPNDEVTRAEFVAAFSRMLYGTSDGEYKSTSKYYIYHMEKLESEWIVTNTNPSMKERRWYVMIMLMRSAK